jgi:hypothetical protein
VTLLSVLVVEVVFAALVIFIGHARVESCKWDMPTVQKRLALGITVAALGFILTLMTWPRLLTIVSTNDSNGVAVILGTIGAAIGGTLADPRQWAGWFGVYWTTLAIGRKRQLLKEAR